VTGALEVDPVDKANHIYRRIGWLEMSNATFFDEVTVDFTLV
jgi:hypothetical protein